MRYVYLLSEAPKDAPTSSPRGELGRAASECLVKMRRRQSSTNIDPSTEEMAFVTTGWKWKGLQRLLRQYLYLGIRKASKLSTRMPP